MSNTNKKATKLFTSNSNSSLDETNPTI